MGHTKEKKFTIKIYAQDIELYAIINKDLVVDDERAKEFVLNQIKNDPGMIRFDVEYRN